VLGGDRVQGIVGRRREVQVQPRLDVQHPVVLAQPLVRREVDDRGVEVEVRRLDRGRVAGFGRRPHPGHRGVDGHRADQRGAFGGEPAGHRLQRVAQRVGLEDAACGRARDVRALELALLEQPFVRERLQRAAQRVAAHLELGREVGLDDPVARCELAAQDPLAEVVGDLGRERPAQHPRISSTVAANASQSSSVIARLSAIIPRAAIQ
jgi:hypothetical protein